MQNKRIRVANTLLNIAKYAIKHQCVDFVIVKDRNSDQSYNTTVNLFMGTIIQELTTALKTLSIDMKDIKKIYYHQMNGMDVIVIGILTGDVHEDYIEEHVV